MVAKGPFMEFLRNRVQESAANTYTEEALPTPCSRSEELAMLIHFIEFHTNDNQAVEGSYASTLTGLYNQSVDGAYGIYHPNNIASYFTFLAIGRDQGTLSEYMEYVEGPKRQVFDPPILYAKGYIYHGVQGVLQDGNVQTSDMRIGYTLEKVSKDDFIDALVE